MGDADVLWLGEQVENALRGDLGVQLVIERTR